MQSLPPQTAPDPQLQQRLRSVQTWLFDMDNSLYPASINLFAQIDARMGAYVARLLGIGLEEAQRLQKSYFHEHGTTLRGLMLSHDVEPRDFLDFVHDIDFSVLRPDPRLLHGLERLPGRKLVFTNGDAAYAGRVLDALGIAHVFEAVYDVEAMEWHAKPDPRAYRRICDLHGIDPAHALFADDMASNLLPAKELGMLTLWVNNGSERGAHGASPAFIDFETHDIAQWLEEME